MGLAQILIAIYALTNVHRERRAPGDGSPDANIFLGASIDEHHRPQMPARLEFRAHNPAAKREQSFVLDLVGVFLSAVVRTHPRDGTIDRTATFSK
jgi:hypothetical protein